jgi:hypothetical protein
MHDVEYPAVVESIGVIPLMAGLKLVSQVEGAVVYRFAC